MQAIVHTQALAGSATQQQNVKIVLVGDLSVGKTSFVISWTIETFPPPENMPKMNYNRNVTVDGKLIDVTLWDTGELNVQACMNRMNK